MSQAIGTLGYVDGGAAEGGGGGGGPSGILIAFRLFDDDGEPASGVDLSGAGEVMLSVGGDAFGARAGAAPTSIANGDGDYYYILDETEVPEDGSFVILKIEKTGYKRVRERRWIGIATADNVDDARALIIAAIANAITAISSAIASAITAINTNTNTGLDAVPTVEEIDAELTEQHGSGSWIGDTAETIRDAILDYEFRTGRTPRGFFRRMDALFFGKATGLKGALARAFRPGGVVPEFEANQDVAAGTRSEVDTTNSEIP